MTEIKYLVVFNFYITRYFSYLNIREVLLFNRNQNRYPHRQRQQLRGNNGRHQ